MIPRQAMTPPRALTLVELLAALALLSAIAAAALAVTRSATGTAAVAVRTTAWERAADSLLASIAADIAAGDLDPIGDRARGDPRVRIQEADGASVLSIRTRDPGRGSCVRAYALRSGHIEVNTTAATTTSQPSRHTEPIPVALGDVASVTVSIKHHNLIVSLAGPAGARRSAAFPLDPEPAP